jgi:alpha-tubulin suppressor-like RCC1 family protein
MNQQKHSAHPYPFDSHPSLAWGYNNAAGLGVGGTATVLRPIQTHLPQGTVDVQGGSDFTVALTADGKVHAWGGNTWGQLGRTPSRVEFRPEVVAIPDHARIVAISVSQDHVLALDDKGSVYAWGRNTYGQLGDGTQAHRHLPQRVPVDNVASISTGNFSSVAVTKPGAVYTWGHSTASATEGVGAGVGVTAELLHATPRQLTLPKGVHAVAADAGQRHLVVLSDRGRLFGFGVTPDGKAAPRRLTTDGSQSRVVAVSAGDNHTIALTRMGAILTWGANDSGQLGHGTPTGVFTPTQLRIPKQHGRVVQVVAGGSSAMALTDSHHVYSWGQGTWGQQGTGTTKDAGRPTVVPIPDRHQVTGLYVGRYHCFATTNR